MEHTSFKAQLCIHISKLKEVWIDIINIIISSISIIDIVINLCLATSLNECEENVDMCIQGRMQALSECVCATLELHRHATLYTPGAE